MAMKGLNSRHHPPMMFKLCSLDAMERWHARRNPRFHSRMLSICLYRKLIETSQSMISSYCPVGRQVQNPTSRWPFSPISVKSQPSSATRNIELLLPAEAVCCLRFQVAASWRVHGCTERLPCSHRLHIIFSSHDDPCYGCSCRRWCSEAKDSIPLRHF